MSNDNETKPEQCTKCKGTKVAEASLQKVKEGESIEFTPIQCQHCGGTGDEPK